jgi:hypothetical protein
MSLEPNLSPDGLGDGLKPPHARHALELVLPRSSKAKPEPATRSPDSPRHEDLTSCGDGRDSSARDDRNTGDLLNDSLALARVYACSDLEAAPLRAFEDGLSTCDRSGGSVESTKKPSPHGVHLDPAVTGQLTANIGVVLPEHVGECPISSPRPTTWS